MTRGQAEDSESGQTQTGEPRTGIRSHSILVADDSEMVCDVVTMGLSRAGYEVTAVRSGEEALSLFSARPEKYPVVIVDDCMPGGMTGQEVMYHLHNVSPKTKVILTSGYILSDHRPEFEKGGFVAFLEKPFRIEHLLRLVKEVFGPSKTE